MECKKKLPLKQKFDTLENININGKAESKRKEQSTEHTMDNDVVSRSNTTFPIVGVGASAGGLAAFEAFFAGMPADIDPNMAFVLVQHLAPDHKSILTKILRKYTRMEVFEVTDGIIVQPNCVYIIPPNRDMALINGQLHLFEPSAPRRMRLPIDFFFRSLAQDQREKAICIILSGSGSDGALGVRAVKGHGGMVMVQDPKTAEYDGMPKSAIATGLVDYVLPPKDMPSQLIAYVSHAFGKGPSPSFVSPPKIEDVIKKICLLLREKTGHDFSHYKESALIRRIQSRMARHQIHRIEDYIHYLRHNPDEANALFRSFLIGVTGFFRDPDAFAVLKNKVIPELFKGKDPTDSVRVWVCGCSTGEEAYTIAILLQEHIERLEKGHQVQIFATDIDSVAIEHARTGSFSASIASDISPERLARFFIHDPHRGLYRIRKDIRDLLIFSKHDVLKDPPFSRLDLICCRNLLIYLKGDAQHRLFLLFHYALKPNGILFLGSSESIGDLTDQFEPIDRKWKIFRKFDDKSAEVCKVPIDIIRALSERQSQVINTKRVKQKRGLSNLRELIVHNLLLHFKQAAVLINRRGDILHIFGRTGKYLEPASGDATLNIIAMARKGLGRPLTRALQSVVTRNVPVSIHGIRIKTNGEEITTNISLRPVQDLTGELLPGIYLLVFEESPIVQSEICEELGPTDSADAGLRKRIAELEAELRSMEEYLQTTLDEIETSNEELLSTNEELQAVNEELQSTNEELETSKEELQSVNEELTSVNAELQNKVAELTRLNNDMKNLLAGTGVATIFVDMDLRIKRYTPSVTQVINLIPSDVGRPIGDIASNLANYDNLAVDVKAVLDKLSPIEKQVQSLDRKWFLMRILPYRTLDNVIEGAVITFVDITEIKQARESEKKWLALWERVLDIVSDAVLVLDRDLRIVSANQSFYSSFHLSPEATIKQRLYDIAGKVFDIPDIRHMLEQLLNQNNTFEDFLLTYHYNEKGRRNLLLNALRFSGTSSKDDRILVVIKDISCSPKEGLKKRTDSSCIKKA